MTKAIVTMMMAAVAMQAETLTAKVEFPFVASGVKMAAGPYRVIPVANDQYAIHNEKTGKKIFLMGFQSAAEKGRAAAGSHLAFACGTGECVLTQVWTESRGVANGKAMRSLEAAPTVTVAMR